MPGIAPCACMYIRGTGHMGVGGPFIGGLQRDPVALQGGLEKLRICNYFNERFTPVGPKL